MKLVGFVYVFPKADSMGKQKSGTPKLQHITVAVITIEIQGKIELALGRMRWETYRGSTADRMANMRT